MQNSLLALLVLTVITTACTTARTSSPATRQSFREGRGPVLVMIGGGVYGAAMFAPHAKVLATDFDVIRVQTLNVERAEQGRPMPDDYSISSEAAAIASTLRALGVNGPVDIAGSSLGAVVALRVATLHPERVRSLVLFEPPAFWALTEEERAADPALSGMLSLTRTMTPTVTPTDEQFQRFRCILGSCPQIPSATDAARAEWDRSRLSMRGLAAVQLHREDPQAIRTLPQRVLLLHGSDSVAFHRRINERLATLIPHVESGSLPGSHTAARTAQDEFVQRLRTFLLTPSTPPL